ncbi:MAG: alanine--glyoxylate aminotransferase family protein [Clostridia bacterium]|nr:alanine--glyoxylate aminotransferase family protein [Clostridia bacterium]
MLNFTVGPVQSNEQVCEIGAQQVPYFRTPEFSATMLQNEQLMLKFCNAPQGARAVFLTGSGSASMESAVINLLNQNDKALVVNGGTFGQRFVDLCKIHDVAFDEIKLCAGQALTSEILGRYNPKDYTAFLINHHETSTGVLYDLNLVSDFCRQNDLLFVLDAISSFLAEDVDLSKYGIDVMITGSQKALACPPGISIMVLGQKAIERVKNNKTKCMYLDLKSALSNGERGQTPFTPAVGTLLQINKRLCQIDQKGGAQAEIARTRDLALYFREQIKDLPFKIFSQSPSNAVTSLEALDNDAYDLFLKLKDEYGIWICPNGGELKDRVFRVGHIGNLCRQDYDVLVCALRKVKGV